MTRTEIDIKGTTPQAASEIVSGVADQALAEFDEQTVSGLEQIRGDAAPDAAVALSLADARALVDHARKTGGEELADRIQI